MENDTLANTTLQGEETAALLKELLANSIAEKDHHRKERTYNLIKVICLGIIALAIVAVGALIVPKASAALTALYGAVDQVNAAAAEVEALSKQLNQADLANLTAHADELITQTGETMGEVMEKVDTALENMQLAMDKVSKFDIEKLNDGIESFTAIVGPLGKLFGVKR